MYDALNKGIEYVLNPVEHGMPDGGGQNPHAASDILHSTSDNSRGSVIAWLNCDEQYLPGTLRKVARHAEKNPGKALFYGDALLVNPDGRLLTYRKNPPLRCCYVMADHLYVQSAAVFFRKAVFESGLRFDSAWKAVGDSEFMIRVLQAGFKAGQIRDYLAACTMTGKNLSQDSVGVDELQAVRRAAPAVFRRGRRGWNLLRFTEKWMRGGYRQSVPFEFELYLESASARQKTVVQQADFRFRWGQDE
jgi:hypothetical protein